MNKKKPILIVLFFLLLVLIWYLFFKPEDYIIRFKAKTSPGTLFVSAEEWNLLNQRKGEFTYEIIDRIPFELLKQNLKKENLDLTMQWSFESINDSITQIRVGISEKNKGVYNRLTAPFINTPFKNTSLELIKGYKNGIEFTLKEKFRVHSISIDTIPQFDYVYVNLKNIKMRDKASQMMKNNSTILEFLKNNTIEIEGLPIIIVDDWNLEKNTLNYKFGFQIKYKDSLPMDSLIKFGRTKSKKALKAIYNGNYIGSDKAWFALYEYANRHHIDIDRKPLEIFHDNPFIGGNELDWIAEIYLPIK